MAQPKHTKKKIDEIKEFIYKGFDIIDKSGTNTEYYKNLLENMTDDEFVKFLSKKYPFKFQMRQSVTEPKMADIVKACDYTGVPLLEEIYLPYYYKNSKGEDVTVTLYAPVKALREKNSELIFKRHWDYNNDYYRTQPELKEKILGVLKSREFHELREKVDGKLYNYTGELI